VTELFDRYHEIVVGDLLLADIRAAFNIVRSLKQEANKAGIVIWNLTDDHRQQLASVDKIPVSISAGYVGRFSRIFSGTLRSARSSLDGADIVTVLETGDGEENLRSKNISKTYPKGTPIRLVIADIATALGLGIGNLNEAIASVRLPTSDTVTLSGVTVFGNAARELRFWLDSVGIEWSVQDGALQLLPKNDTLKSQAVKLTPQTGLVGSPTVDNKGVMKATALLIPDLEPGRSVIIESRFVSGAYRIEQVTYTGDKLGGDWYAQIEGKAFRVKP
jgi:hypothetical protein